MQSFPPFRPSARRTALLIAVCIVALLLSPGGLKHAAAAVESVANDAFANATLIPAAPYATPQDIAGATTAVDDPNFPAQNCPGDARFHTVWFQFTPSSSRTFTVTTRGSNYDTVLGLWTGTEGNLTLVACNDDEKETIQTSNLSIALVGGTKYYIEVASYYANLRGSASHLRLAVNANPSPPGKPKLSAPRNYQTVKKPALTLDWTDSGATSYKLQVRRDSTLGAKIINTTVALSNYPTTLGRGVHYFWRVNACNGQLCSGWTDWWNFTVKSK